MMRLQDSVAKQFDFVYKLIAANTAGMTQEHSLAQPSPGGNCANWVLGHLTNVQNDAMRLVGEKPVWENDQLKRAGYDPIEEPAGAIDWETLRDRFLASGERCVKAVSALSEEASAEDVPHPFGGTCSRGELLSLLAFHQAYHAGQLAMCRRIAGLEGVIKAPGQAQAQKV